MRYQKKESCNIDNLINNFTEDYLDKINKKYQNNKFIYNLCLNLKDYQKDRIIENSLMWGIYNKITEEGLLFQNIKKYKIRIIK